MTYESEDPGANRRWRWRSPLGLAGWLLLCFAAAAIGGLFQPGDWYAGLRKPAWNPPAWVFAPVWTLLYTMMAIAAWLVWVRGGFAKHGVALWLFLAQLLFNGLWSALFFGLRNPGLGLADLGLLWLALLATVAAFWRARPIAAALLLPYLVWTTFALALNHTLWRLNS